MIKKIFAKLVNWEAQRGNNAERIHGSEQKDKNKLEADLAKERHDNIMRNQGYRSETTTVPAGQVERHDDKAAEKAGE